MGWQAQKEVFIRIDKPSLFQRISADIQKEIGITVDPNDIVEIRAALVDPASMYEVVLREKPDA